MARSNFRLPNIEELSKQQHNALDLPLEGQHLIVGGPGTGKSVVALLRAGRLAKAKKNYLFLVYNVLLGKNSYALCGGELKAETWKKWFKDNFQTWFGCSMPIKKNAKNEDNEDWDAILNIKPLEDIDTSMYLVIDEGQDMPPQFYITLINIGFENFYVVADQNQRITDHNSSRRDIEKNLGLNPADTVELTSNYRNSLPIARLAQHFFTNDPASPPVELPKPKGGDRIPRMLRYDGNAEGKLANISAAILKAYDRNVDKLICIITPNEDIRKKFCDSLRNANVPLDHEMPEIQTYASTERIVDGSLLGMAAEERCARCGAEMRTKRSSKDGGIFWACTQYFSTGCTHTKNYVSIDFRNGGIAVINQQSIKGLEFDTVCIADIDTYWGTRDELMKKFYVMISRARDTVVLLRSGDISQQVEAIIPNDDTILARR